jgi:hypothetical protein
VGRQPDDAQRSGASRVAAGASGPSIDRLAEALVGALLGYAHPRTRRYTSITLTAAVADGPTIELLRDALCATIEQRWPTVGLLVVLDVAESGRYHLHLLLLCPPDVARVRMAARIKRLWRRLCKRSSIDAGRRAQDSRVIDTEDALRYQIFQHHLAAAGRVDAPLQARVAAVGPLAVRVRAVGPLERIWREVASRLHVANISAPEPIIAPGRTRTTPLPKPKAGPGGRCGWCVGTEDEQPIPNTAQKTARWCSPVCGKKASNALTAIVRDLAGSFDVTTSAIREAVTKFVNALETRGWTRVEALRAARGELGRTHPDELYEAHAWVQPFELITYGDVKPQVIALGPHRDQYGRCACGAKLANRLDALTCGVSKCRKGRQRAAERDKLAEADALVVRRLARHDAGLAAMVDKVIVEDREQRSQSPFLEERFEKLRPVVVASKWRTLDELCRLASVRMTATNKRRVAAVLIARGVAFSYRDGDPRFRAADAWSTS